MTAKLTRTLGRSGIEVSALGLGCWAVGGPWTFNGSPAGWSGVDDAESLRAIQRACDLGATFFDTAANYGAGHSERLLAQAFKGKRDKVVIATKFGYRVDEAAKAVIFYDDKEEESDVASRLRESAEASLKRLDTDYIDVYQLHVWGLAVERALEAREVLEDLVKQGKIRAYGWSTDFPKSAEFFAGGEHCATIQVELNVLDDNAAILAICERENLAAINRGPLAMGLLTGKYTGAVQPSADDVRGQKSPEWMKYFKGGTASTDYMKKVAAIREILTSNGRSLAQGALAWLWARSPKTVPIPGFRTVKQVEENCKAMDFGPLTADQMVEINHILGR